MTFNLTHRKFMATLMAAAIAITSLSAAPAKADDAAKIIAGVAALAIIGAAIAEANDDDVYVSQHYYPRYGNRHFHGRPHYKPRRYYGNKHYHHHHYHGHKRYHYDRR